MTQAPQTFPGVAIPVAAGATVRSGVVVPPPGAPDDVVGTVPAEGTYTAFKQCPGMVVDEGPENFWWVQIQVGELTGWISAISVLQGADNEPIAGVPTAPCVNV